MKKYIGILAVFFVVLAACKEDKVVFDVPVPEEGIRFEPVSGGAILCRKTRTFVPFAPVMKMTGEKR